MDRGVNQRKVLILDEQSFPFAPDKHRDWRERETKRRNSIIRTGYQPAQRIPKGIGTETGYRPSDAGQDVADSSQESITRKKKRDHPERTT